MSIVVWSSDVCYSDRRYVAAWLATKVGEVVPARITGVQPFGFFATVDGLGGDGLVPVSTLGSECFFYDEAARTLDSERGSVSYGIGQRLEQDGREPVCTPVPNAHLLSRPLPEK